MKTPTDRLLRWILTEGRDARTVPGLLQRCAERLREDAPVDRIWCGTKLLHPQAAAYIWIWEDPHPPVARDGGAWDSCGAMAVKGVAAPVEVYRPT